jgi:F-box protein 18 (helicase)
LPGLISELKQHHTSTNEEADIIFSTVHRCKGMEYDEVTLLNDFITEEKLKRHVKDQGGDKIDEVNKNRLAEEVNILYVAATRARNKLAIPAEINPLKSIALATPVSPLLNTTNTRYTRNFSDDWDIYTRSLSRLHNEIRYDTRTTNHGKRWTEEEQNQLTELYKHGVSLKEIAKKLKRGENGVRMKLMDIGLIKDEDIF